MKILTTIVFLVVLGLFSCQKDNQIVPGVSIELAKYRKVSIEDIHYNIDLQIPQLKQDPISGSIKISFQYSPDDRPIVLDFNTDSTHIKGVFIDQQPIEFLHTDEHIIIDTRHFIKGTNSISVEFVAGDLSLNRNDDYLYTLFVPDRASTAFPCFDQPDLKATFKLTLTIPSGWKALSNAPLLSSTEIGRQKKMSFRETKPISTYLFAFVTGNFYETQHTTDGSTMRMLYRETDSTKVEQNTEEIFRLHAQALKWMINYTNRTFPFQKFDFALIPTFQYGGMEHPGSIFYKESSLFLNETATQNDKLRRAGLIAHETAHIWFGDLVTMKWFDDVWVKEVFANFMSDKIVNPNFPNIHHDLKFLLRHHPGAYGVDRTSGTNAIKQPLENLKQAGMMYGAIIYNKAPIMMKHLENLTGEEKFQEGMREYIAAYPYSNADWSDLIGILDTKTEHDLGAWSKTWIETPGMPEYTYIVQGKDLVVQQHDPQQLSRNWSQVLYPLVLNQGVPQKFEIELNSNAAVLEIGSGDLILLNGNGTEYGAFILDDTSIGTITTTIHTLNDRFMRGKIWLDLYESFLHGKIPPVEYLHTLEKAILIETDKQLTNLLLRQLRTVYWMFLPPSQRGLESANVEKTLWDLMKVSRDIELKSAYFRSYLDLATTGNGLGNLYQIWNGDQIVEGLPLGEEEYNDIALALAVKGFESSDVILQIQLERIKNPDRRSRFAFMLPAVSENPEVRDQFFESLKDAKYREVEPWVISALYYLHHPLREVSSEHYLLPSLELLEEIQLTGDIFFPKRWLDATFSGHQTQNAVKIVEEFLESNPEYNSRLRDKILQSTDMLYRANEIIRKDTKIL